MIICEKCGVQLESEDVYSANNEKMCEECMIKYKNPPKPCSGPPSQEQPS